MSKPYLDAVHRLAAEALANGAERTGLCSCKWNLAGDCQAPVSRSIEARPSATNASPYIVVARNSKGPFWVDLELRCRKCDPCRKIRRAIWAARATAETAAAVRTWFGTLTLSTEAHTLALARARVKLSAQGVDFDALPYGEQFICRHAEISPEVTKFLKRVRKGVAHPLRFLVVAEAHKTGLPHYHMLVHEQHPEGQVRHAALTAQWKFGFTNFKLITDEQRPAYLCKYLAKTTVARVRASVGYGKDVLEHSYWYPVNVQKVLTPLYLSAVTGPDNGGPRVGSLTGKRLDCDAYAIPFPPHHSEQQTIGERGAD